MDFCSNVCTLTIAKSTHEFDMPGLNNVEHEPFNPLITPNDLHIRRAVSPLNSQTTYIYVTNRVSKFGAILFTPIWLTFVDCNASVPLKVRLSQRSQNVPPPSPKPLHKHRYIYIYLDTSLTAHFSQLTNTVLTELAMVIACSGVHCGLKYKHWPMKQKLFLEQKGCQWRTVPI